MVKRKQDRLEPALPKNSPKNRGRGYGSATIKSGIDLEVERRLAKLLLATHDMSVTVALVERVTAERSDRDMVLDSIGIVACYGRPFKGRGGKPAVAEPFLHILSTDERALHDRLIDMRDKDHAHGDLYQGRVRIQPGDADLWIRTGIDPSMVTPEDIRTTIRHATRLTVRGPTRAEIAHLRWLAIKFGFEFQRAAKELAPQVLSARIRAGDLDWFALAEP